MKLRSFNTCNFHGTISAFGSTTPSSRTGFKSSGFTRESKKTANESPGKRAEGCSLVFRCVDVVVFFVVCCCFFLGGGGAFQSAFLPGASIKGFS